MNVPNKKCIRNLSIKNMKSARSRNIIAVIAIALTTVLFTSLFTIMMSVVNGFEQSNFRQVGGYEHGGLKNLTAEQFEEFKDDPHIKEYGKRMFIGIPQDEPFNKSQVEISSADEKYAGFTFVDFAEGGLPKENTNEAAADTRVLNLLGISPEIGKEFTVTFDVAGKKTTETFILCGYWEYDSVMPASNIFLSFSKGEEIFEKLGTVKGSDGITGRYSLDFMLKSGSVHIEDDICEIIKNHGYQYENSNAEKYIDYGVNWGYLSAQANNLIDVGTALAIIVILLIIVFTGYLIIYNVFRISVSNDIRFYGLLKTIGTTGKQIKKIISIQALILSAVGIPVGLVLGYCIGLVLSPIVTNQLSLVKTDSIYFNPLIFVCATIFSLGTVILSCNKPGRIASEISPVEAVRYTEAVGKNTTRKSKKGVSVVGMAFANLTKTKGKTAITMISLALSVLLLNLTVTFANGFDMDKYLKKLPVDYILADAGYFLRGSSVFWNEDMALSETVVSYIDENADISSFGATYGSDRTQYIYTPKDYIFQKLVQDDILTEDDETAYFGNKYNIDGLYPRSIMLYGMDKFCIDKMTVIDGDISKLYEKGNYIAAVYMEDDYGKPIYSSNWAKVGDKITMEYCDSEERIWLDTETGNIYENYKDIPEGVHCSMRPIESHLKEYEVVVTLTVPYTLSYRYYSTEQFILNADTFKEDTGTENIMYLAFDVKDGAGESAERFMSDYTNNIEKLLDYESKQSYAEDFKSFRNMFLILGTTLSFIVGFIGILNFTNAVLTGIFARYKEFAVLQSIGMTGAQLKKMLVTEGFIYTFGATFSSLVLAVILKPVAKYALEILWFFSFKFTVTPILILIPIFAILGAIIPLCAYKIVSKKSIVERLREY